MEKQFIDYYKVLGLCFGATEEQIKRAYRNLAKRLHPDGYIGGLTKEREEELRIRFTSVTEAYDILNNKEKRLSYDILYQKEMSRMAEEERRREEARREAERRREEARQQEEARQAAAEESYYEESPRPRHRRARQESFASKVKKSYSEIRNEEKKMSLTKRHRRLERMLNSEAYDDQTVAEDIAFSIKKGALHVGYEFIYQLSKLTYINEDTVTKYVIRNRKTIAAIIIAGTIFSASAKKPVEATDTPKETEYTTVTPENSNTSTSGSKKTDMGVNQDNVLLTRYHTVTAGDTISALSSDSNTTINKIMQVNGLSSSTIFIGQELKIPYYIKNYELEYYTESIPVEGKSLSEIAEERNTDVATLIRLNSESIQDTGYDTYIIMSDTIMVPNFITIDELNTIKDNNKQNH